MQMKWIDDGYFNTERRDLSQIRRVLVITMVLNFAATAVKLAAGLATGALSVIADALDSLFDGLSNAVGLAGLHAAGKPPDAEHPYGHRKFETLSALSIAFLLFLTTYQLLVTAWNRLQSEVVPQVNLWVIAAMVLSMLIQALTSAYELRQGRKQRSEVLVADALHTRASILVSLSVLGGLGLVRLGFPIADPLLAAVVALVIGKIGVDILRETLPVLVDRAPISPYEIAEVVGDVGGVESFHRVRSRGAPGNAAVDLHVRVSPAKSMHEANAVADEVRRRLLNLDGITDVTVHVEAQREMDTDARDIFATIRHAAGELGLLVHEVVAHQIGQNLYCEVHVGVDPELSLGEAHALVDRLEQEVRARLPQLAGIHTHIELATTQVLIGDQAPEEIESRVRREVQRVVAQIPDLEQPHNIRVRRDPSAGNRLFISLEALVSPDIPVTVAHRLASQVEQELSRRLDEVADVSVHLEPPENGG